MTAMITDHPYTHRGVRTSLTGTVYVCYCNHPKTQHTYDTHTQFWIATGRHVVHATPRGFTTMTHPTNIHVTINLNAT